MYASLHRLRLGLHLPRDSWLKSHLCAHLTMPRSSSPPHSRAIACTAENDASSSHSHRPHVAIIGAGLSGSVCADRLARTVKVTCFDMGAKPGGRASTRHNTISSLQFDHGCQFFRASTSGGFVEGLLKSWIAQGVVQPWMGSIGHVDVLSGRFIPRDQQDLAAQQVKSSGGFFDSLRPGPLYVAVPSMGTLPIHLTSSSSIELQQGIRVTRAHLGEDGRWLLSGVETQASSTTPTTDPAPSSSGSKAGAAVAPNNNGSAVAAPAAAEGPLGTYDAVVFTDSLVGRPGSVGHVQISGTKGLEHFMSRLSHLQRVPLFTLMLAFETDEVLLPFDAATLSGSRGLQWICNNTSKPGRRAVPGMCYQCWTVITTPEFASTLVGTASSNGALPAAGHAYLEDKAQIILDMLKADLQCVLGGKELPQPIHLQAQRWGSAYVANPLGELSLSDAALKFAACGDYCSGPGIENAVLSGLAAAEAVAEMLAVRTPAN